MQKAIQYRAAGKFLIVAILLCACCVAVPRAHAQESGEVKQPVTATLNLSSAEVSPGGTVRAEVHFTIPAPWHIYWKNPGDAGLPTRIKFALPEGYHDGELEWPQYETITQPGNVMAYGYEKEVTLASALSAPVSAKPGDTADIKADVRWLACSTLCIPGHATLEKKITVSNGQ